MTPEEKQARLELIQKTYETHIVNITANMDKHFKENPPQSGTAIMLNFEALRNRDYEWLISELKAAWKREKTMRGTLRGSSQILKDLNILFEINWSIDHDP